MSAAELKDQGNAAFSSGDYHKAVELFTKAIEASGESDPKQYVLYSNRSGAYAALKDYKNALEDANRTIALKSDWAKGYNRKAAAEHGLGDLDAAVASYNKALELDPQNAQAQKGKQSAEAARGGQANPGAGLAGVFKDPQVIARLQNNPKTREYMKDPAFLKKLDEMMADPLKHLGSMDNQMMEVLSVIMGGDLPGAAGAGAEADKAAEEAKAKAAEEEKKKKAAEEEAKKKQEASNVDPAKAAADEEKTKGNALYKQRKFDEAIEHYNKAFELYKDITYLNNRSAAEYEKGDYDAAVKTGLQAVEESRELHSDYKAVAKALARIGSSYLKQDKLKEAIEYFDKSLTEQRSPDVLNKLRSTQRELRHREEQAYIDPEKAEAAREQGNTEFKEGRFPESVKSYTEAIKRNPSDPRGYANRAASFLKLMNYPDVVRDCDKAIELDPSFIKAYTRKATACNIMKQYQKSMETLEAARAVDVEHKHSREIEQLYHKASSLRFAPLPGETEEQRAERATKDPEIEQIVGDPVMRTILQQAASDPAALQDHMKNPEIRRKVNLLIAAGIIRTR